MGLTRSLRRFGVEVDFVPTCDLAAIKAALRPTTRMVFFETVANPVCTLTDVPALAALVHATSPGCLVVADNTFLTPVLHRSLEHGADLVVHSLTKGMIGSGTALAGAVVGSTALIGRVRDEGRKDLTGAVCDPHAAFLLTIGLKTLHVRMRAHAAAAAQLVEALEGALEAGLIEKLCTPSARDSPFREAAARLLDHTCPVVAFEMPSAEAASRVLDGLTLARRAVSLGDAETLVCAPAVSTHAGYTAEERAAYGIADGLVRVSVGLEAPEELVEDIIQAIKSAQNV